MAIAGPFQGPPSVQAAQEALPCVGAVGMVQPNTDAVVNKATEERQAFAEAWE
jgi:hypothetical protein